MLKELYDGDKTIVYFCDACGWRSKVLSIEDAPALHFCSKEASLAETAAAAKAGK